METFKFQISLRFSKSEYGFQGNAKLTANWLPINCLRVGGEGEGGVIGTLQSPLGGGLNRVNR